MLGICVIPRRMVHKDCANENSKYAKSKCCWIRRSFRVSLCSSLSERLSIFRIIIIVVLLCIVYTTCVYILVHNKFDDDRFNEMPLSCVYSMCDAQMDKFMWFLIKFNNKLLKRSLSMLALQSSANFADRRASIQSAKAVFEESALPDEACRGRRSWCRLTLQATGWSRAWIVCALLEQSQSGERRSLRTYNYARSVWPNRITI